MGQWASHPAFIVCKTSRVPAGQVEQGQDQKPLVGTAAGRFAVTIAGMLT